MLSRTMLVFLWLATAGVPPAAAATDSLAHAPGAPAPRGTRLAGRVTDPAGRPIPAVSVGVAELRRGAVTGADGRYEVAELPLGTYHVSFQRLGYAPVVRHLAFTPGLTRLDATLAESVVELPGAQVSATANPSTALTSPQPVSVLEGAELRRAVEATLGGTLERLPGVRSFSTGGGIGKPSIRGLRSDRVVIAADDLRVEQQGWGDEHGPQIESADAGRIEVIRGPASVLYGSDALGGVVHVIPRELPVAFGRGPVLGGHAFGALRSAEDGGEGGVSLEGAAGGLGARASFTGRSAGDVRTPAGERFNSGHRAATGSGSVALRGARGSASVSYARRDERIEINEDPAEDPAATPYQKIVSDLARVSAILPVPGGDRIDVVLGAERNRRSEFESRDDAAVAVGLLARTWNGLAHYHHRPLGGFEGLIGASLQSTRFTRFGEEALIPPSTGRRAALFVFEEIEAGRWRFAAGARYDHHTLDVEADDDLAVAAQERSWDAVTGNLGALVRVAEPVAIVAHLGRGFRAPSSFDLFANGVHEGTVAYERGNPDLDVETSLNAELGVRIQTPRARIEVEGFVHRIHDFIYSRPTGATDPESGYQIFQAVQGNARLRGFEATAELHPERHLHLTVSADWVRGDNTETDVPLPWIPPPRLLYGIRFEPDAPAWADAVQVGIRAESVARATRIDPADVATAAYTLVHAEAGLTLPVGRAAAIVDVAVHNLLDEPHRDFLSRIKAWSLAPGRDFRLRVATRF